jgi:hypothetical protein
MRLTTPGAVLLGLVALAIAVFFGLKTRAGAGSEQTVTSRSPASAAAGVSLPLPEPRASAPAPTGAAADATRALAAQHDALVKACWGPGSAQKEARVSFLIRAQFDAQGHLATKAQLSPRGQVRVEVSECIANALTPITIAVANAPASVEVPFTIP